MKMKELVKEVVDFNRTKELALQAFENYQKNCSFQLSRSDKDTFIDGFTYGYEYGKSGKK